jgi:hypothetical protein
LRIGALALLIVLHAAVFGYWYRSRFVPAPEDSVAIQVRLLDEASPPTPEPLPQTAPPNARVPPTPARQSMAAHLVVEPSAPTPAPAPVLFNRDGSIRLPAPLPPTPLEAGLARGRELLARGHNIIHCRRSKLDNSPTPAQAATAAASAAHMTHLVMGNPLDPLNDVGQGQQEDAAGEHAARKRAIEEQACDWSY